MASRDEVTVRWSVLSRRRYFLIVLICLVLTTAFQGVTYSVRADDGPITVLSQSTESHFRESFIFHVRARSTAGNIVKARIIWQQSAIDANIAHPIPDFDPAPEVTLEYTWQTAFETTPPWQIIFYRWEFTDSAGNVYRTDRTRAEISDDTHKWQTLSDDKVRVYWYDQSQAFGKELLAAAQRGYAHVVKATGYTPQEELRIVIYNDQDSFCSIFRMGGCQSWYAGVTLGSITIEWLEEDQRFVMYQVVPHELAHAFLNDWLGGRVDALPRWFNEGQAVNNELEGLQDEITQARRLAQFSLLTRLPLLDASAVEGRDSALLVARWYAQAASLVAFLYDRWGLDSLGKIVEQVKAGSRFEDALTGYTGLSMDDFELAWRAWLGATEPPPTIFPTPTFMPFPPTPTSEPR